MGSLNRSSLGLLDILAARCDCAFLSDLAEAGGFALLPHHLLEINAAAFSLREWEEAVLYLTGREQSFATPEQAKQFLIRSALQKGAENKERKRET